MTIACSLDDTMSGWLVENNTFVDCDIGVLSKCNGHIIAPVGLLNLHSKLCLTR